MRGGGELLCGTAVGFNDHAIAPRFSRSSSGVVMRCEGWFSSDGTYVNNNGEADKGAEDWRREEEEFPLGNLQKTYLLDKACNV